MGRRWFYLSAPLVAVVVYPVAALCVAAFNGQPWLVVVSSMHGIVYVVGLVLGSALAVAVVTAAGRAANRLQLANPYEFEMPPREAFYRLCAAAVLFLMLAWFDLWTWTVVWAEKTGSWNWPLRWRSGPRRGCSLPSL
jgi:hypothetical protein